MVDSTMVDRPMATAVADWLKRFETALENTAGANGNVLGWDELWADECYWRDLVAFTWNIITLEGRAAIGAMVLQQAPLIGASGFVLDSPALPMTDATQAWFTFNTATARCRGHVQLRDGRAYVLLTAIVELIGHEEMSSNRRPDGIQHRAEKGRRTWLDQREETARTLGTSVQPYCLIVGGGQNGLMLAARLKRLNVPTLVIDALPKPGDGWRGRYRSLYLHDPVFLDHFPYMPFPDHWPLYTSKDKIADWLEMYAKVMELDFWGNTRCTAARYDSASGEWVVTVERDIPGEGSPGASDSRAAGSGASSSRATGSGASSSRAAGSGASSSRATGSGASSSRAAGSGAAATSQTLTLRPKQLVLATGLSGAKYIPNVPGASSFAGEQYHSGDHRSGAGLAGKRCIVIGSNNSAHDICVDLWEHDAQVTMIQRSPTIVVRADTMRKFAESIYYAQPGADTNLGDLMGMTMPFRPRTTFEKGFTNTLREIDADFYQRLERSGFQLWHGEDETGFFMAYYRRAGGYYIDVGGSELIASGEIKVRPGSVAEIVADGVRMSDGTFLPADVIVYATGYRPMNEWVSQLISPEVERKVGPCWGLGSGIGRDVGAWDGELRNMWKPTAQEALWFQGGNLAQSRFHSLHLALQLKARMEGIPIPLYRPR